MCFSKKKVYMYVKLPFENLNHNPYPPHLTSAQ